MDSRDVIVVGAGPAGATAAALLAAADRDVLLLDAGKFPRSLPCTGWVSGHASRLLEQIDPALSRLFDAPLTDVTFRSRDLSKSIKPKSPSPPAYVIQRSVFEAELVRAAGVAGAEVRETHAVHCVESGEDGVRVESKEHEVIRARMVLIATGVSRDLLAGAGFRGVSEQPHRQVAHVTVEKEPSKSNTGGRATIVVGPAGGQGFCVAIERTDGVSVTLNMAGTASVLKTKLAELCGLLAAKGCLSIDLSNEASKRPVIAAPGVAALDMDTHVGKLALVIGDAGGFFAAASHEGIYPAMWSGAIAARVVGESWNADHPQDVLKTYDTAWRLEMGDYLRPPNTDLQLLLPLVFSNQAMADRVAAAFFGGENL